MPADFVRYSSEIETFDPELSEYMSTTVNGPSNTALDHSPGHSPGRTSASTGAASATAA